MRKNALHIALPVLYCGIICIGYRADDNTVHYCVRSLLETFQWDINLNLQTRFPLTDFMRFNLPVGLWLFSLMILCKDWVWHWGKQKINLFFGPFLFSVSAELLQYLNWTDGTFDPLDLISIFTFSLLAFAYCNHKGFQSFSIFPNTFRVTCVLVLSSLIYLADVVTIG